MEKRLSRFTSLFLSSLLFFLNCFSLFLLRHWNMKKNLPNESIEFSEILMIIVVHCD